MDIALTIDYLVPQANYRGSVTANNQIAYANIVWLDTRTQPTWDEIVSGWAELESRITTAARKKEILKELDALDLKTVRAIREDGIKDEETGETWLEYYQSQITALREELAEL